MKERIITGVVGGFGLLTLLWYGGYPYTILLMALALIGFNELLRMNSMKLISKEGIVGAGTVLLLIINHTSLNAYLNNIQEISIVTSSLIIFLTLTVIKKNKITFEQVSYILIGALYIGFGFSYMLATRLSDNGLSLTLLVILATWASDSGAYFTGRLFGKKKLSPEISPKKTIEGSLGGIISAILISLVFNYFVKLTDYFMLIIWTGLLISVIGQMGDLVESALKRGKNVKDSGALLPGHGGVLDRFDSLIFVFPILHILHIL